MRIISKEFGISKTEIDTNSNLISEYNLSGWELEWLYVKIEAAFKIQIHLPIPNEDLRLKRLVNDVLIVRPEFDRKRKAC